MTIPERMSNMIRRLLCLLAALMMLAPAALAEDVPDADPTHNAEMDAALDKIFPRFNTTGAVVVAARNGEIVYEHVYGLADRRDKKPVTPETYFKTASVTKMVSAIRVMQLVEEGSLSLDEPIGLYLGFDVYNPRYPETPVTLRHLLSHTSSIQRGFSILSPMDKWLDASLNKKQYWEEWEPGTKYSYSNLGAGLMGSLMEVATASDVNSCVVHGLFEPLGIDAGYRVHLLKEPEKAALRYNKKGTLARGRNFYLTEEWDPFPDPYNHFKITIGDVWIRGADLCRIGMMMCNGGTLDGVQILKPETVELMKETVTADSPYGLCVERVHTLLEGRTVYGHQGMSEGVMCNLYWEPESDFVFAIITNGCVTTQTDHICKLTRRVFEKVWPVYGDGTALVKY